MSYEASVTHCTDSTGMSFKINFKEYMHTFRNEKINKKTQLSYSVNHANFNENNIKIDVKYEFFHEIKQTKPCLMLAGILY